MKKRHTSLLSGIWREIQKKIIKNSQKNAKFDEENEKKSEIQVFNRENMLVIFG